MVEQMLSWHALDLQIESRSMGIRLSDPARTPTLASKRWQCSRYERCAFIFCRKHADLVQTASSCTHVLHKPSKGLCVKILERLKQMKVQV